MSVEKVPARSVGEPQARAKGNHDNPVSGNHPNGTLTGVWRTKGPRTGWHGTKFPQQPSSTHPKHPEYKQERATTWDV